MFAEQDEEIRTESKDYYVTWRYETHDQSKKKAPTTFERNERKILDDDNPSLIEIIYRPDFHTSDDSGKFAN